MDPTTLIGIAVALGGLLVTMLADGVAPSELLLLPAIVLVVAGTAGAVVAGSAMDDVRKVGRWVRQALAPARVPTAAQRIDVLVDLAGRARREGLLALDRQVGDVDDPFLRRGLRLAIDGTDPERLKAYLEAEISVLQAEDRAAARFFARMGGYAPTVGIIGTVVGLMHVMGRLDQPDTIGPLVASAFVATLWGVLSANVLWLPMSARILRTSALRSAQLELLLTGIAEIQAGTNPRLVRQRLTGLLPPAEAAAARARAA
ncbi:motility protein A [Blastococcus sp. SYSU D00669]